MKIKEIYMIFDNNNQIKHNYFVTFGIAQCNLNGCISLQHLIDSLKGTLKRHQEIEKEIDELLKKWEEAETAKRRNETIVKILTDMSVDKKNSYSVGYEKLYKLESNLYASYSNLIDVILTHDEIQKIQKQIHYDFMSSSFIEKMIELLESKEV